MNIYLYSKNRNERIYLEGLCLADYHAFKLWNATNSKMTVGISGIILLNDEETSRLFEDLMKER